jgi:hypothetical protein
MSQIFISDEMILRTEVVSFLSACENSHTNGIINERLFIKNPAVTSVTAGP